MIAHISFKREKSKIKSILRYLERFPQATLHSLLNMTNVSRYKFYYFLIPYTYIRLTVKWKSSKQKIQLAGKKFVLKVKILNVIPICGQQASHYYQIILPKCVPFLHLLLRGFYSHFQGSMDQYQIGQSDHKYLLSSY